MDHPHALPPHKRAGQSVSEVLCSDPRLSALEVFLDRGFQFRAEDRFQTCKEFLDRLGKLATVVQSSVEDPQEVAVRLAAEMHAMDRTAQLHQLNSKLQSQGDRMRRIIQSFKIAPFQVTLTGGFIPKLPDRYDSVFPPVLFGLMMQTNSNLALDISFHVGARAQECTLFRFMQLSPHFNMPVIPPCGEFKILAIFNPDYPPADADLVACLKDSINVAMTTLQKELIAN